MIKTISSFNEVELKNDLKYLILCDIDGTILHFPDRNRMCRDILTELCLDDEEEYETELANLKRIYICAIPPTPTDYEGFVNMLKKINNSNSTLMFLTARGVESEKMTKKHLQQIRVSPDGFEIHYTGSKISKGEYIKKNIDLSNWENIIFIDDYDSYIKSVMDLHPQIVCYKFVACESDQLM